MHYRGKHVRKTPNQNPHWLNVILGTVLTVVILAALIYPWAEPYIVLTDNASLISSQLPPGINTVEGKSSVSTLKLAYLTDIHWDSFFPKTYVRNIIRRVNRSNPDVILLGGDYGSDTEEGIRFFEKMPKFRARYGVFAVLGDCDKTDPDRVDALCSAMRSAGVTPLVNESKSIRIGEGYIYVAGIDDGDSTPEDMSTLSKSFAQSDYVIYLSHRPTSLPTAISALSSDGKINWFDLGLFGHTHGGQFSLFTKQLGLEKVDNRYSTGWKQENRIDLLQSPGVGTKSARIRLFHPPKVHIITVSGK